MYKHLSKELDEHAAIATIICTPLAGCQGSNARSDEWRALRAYAYSGTHAGPGLKLRIDAGAGPQMLYRAYGVGGKRRVRYGRWLTGGDVRGGS